MKIGNDTHLKMLGLCELAKHHGKAMVDIEKMLGLLLNEPDDGCGYYGHISDCLYEDDPAAHLMRALKITVVDVQKQADG
jgi:hypothetical protein